MLENKIIILTGATRGIGKAITKKLMNFSNYLVLVSRNFESLKKLKSKLNLLDEKTLLIAADVSLEEDCKRIIEETVQKFRKIDILINNAAQFCRKKVVELELEDFKRVWETNVKGPYLLSKYSLKYMIPANEGTILNISSTSGKRGYVGGSAYAASKFALNGFMECLLREVREYNIRVLTISPSLVDTTEKDNIKSAGKGVYMRAEDVADAVVFALSLPQRALIKDIEIWGTNP